MFSPFFLPQDIHGFLTFPSQGRTTLLLRKEVVKDTLAALAFPGMNPGIPVERETHRM